MVKAETETHVFILSRLDYCDVLFSSLPCASAKSLQMVQNAAARLNHIIPILASLHWLPIHVRLDFKVLLLTYKFLNWLHHTCLFFLNLIFHLKCSQSARLLYVLKVKKK